ncbi:hypothetical protein BDBG_00603 [Blastomyces gilchristii SLH14081]|uniref:NTP binding protein n=1 Tax=Blastomyces gilchristii (strain SLH14081) TaxID=559298 RepID=A0A179UBP7_BLAGS|nr:uncharacterized protein BDBG_00603 [Blastomyces gilchristii SLH14081]OAT03952.1 hypothetical protein BDBG_00603 [Blastomyces gilchristii SLH14081]
MPRVVSGNQSSSIASTKPTLLSRREDGVRRKDQRSSSWSAWIPPPLLGQPDNKSSRVRSSSLGQRGSPDIAPTSGQKALAEKRGGFRKWGKRKDKKSVTFEEDVAVNLQDCDSASGTVRRQKLSTVGSVSGIFSRTTRDEEQNRAPDPVSRLDFANRSGPVPGIWVGRHAPSQEGTHHEGADREYWLSLRRQIEESAKLQDELHKRQATKSGKKERTNRKHQRTVSRDDQLIARGANPRTGVVSPSIMSGGSDSSFCDSREENATLQKWRLKGNEWISLDKNEKSPFPSPSGNEIAQAEFPGLQRSKTESVGLITSAPPTEFAPNSINPEDKFVVNMPSAREPSPLTMTAQQIVDFQKTLERVHHEGEQMLDPDTLPTPRPVTPTGISTPPRRLTKNFKEKIIGRKRDAKSPSPSLAFVEPPAQGYVIHAAITSPNKPVPDIKVTSSSGDPEYVKLCNEEMGQGQPTSHAHACSMNGGPFLGQSGGHGEKCTQISWPRTAPRLHCLSPQSMNARKFLTQKQAFQANLISRTACEEELAERSQVYYPLTMAQILHDHNLSGLLRKSPGGSMKGGSVAVDPVLDCSQLHKLPEQENLSTIITTTTPTSTSTTSMTLPLAMDQRPLNHDINPGTDFNANSSTIPGKIGLCHYGTCCNHQQCPCLSETSGNSVLAIEGRAEQNINRGIREIPLNLSRNMHGSTHISGLNDPSNLPFTEYCAPYIQNGYFNPAKKIHSAQRSLVSTGLGPSPMYVNMVPVMNKGAVFQEDAVKRVVRSDSGSVNSLMSGHFRPNAQSDNGRDIEDRKKDNLLNNQNNSTPAVQFLHYIVRERHTFNFLRLIAVQFLAMALHCLRVTFSFCDFCHKFSKTGVLPRAPRSFHDLGILILDTGRACIYFAVLVVACTFLARGLGFLATVASWLVWALKLLTLA